MTNLSTRPPLETLRTLLEKSKAQLALALPKHITVDRMIRVALTAVQRTPKLLESNPITVLGAIMLAAQLGLELDGILGHAYLVPFWNSKGKRFDCQMMIGYRGLLALAYRSGQVADVCCQVVHGSDKFTMVYGTEPRLEHIRHASQEADAAPQLLGAYAIAHLKGGGVVMDYMTAEEIGRVRKRSKAANEGPWVTDTEEMWRKTVLRRLAKHLPLTPEALRAVVADEYLEAGAATPGEIGPIDMAPAESVYDEVEGPGPSAPSPGAVQRPAKDAMPRAEPGENSGLDF